MENIKITHEAQSYSGPGLLTLLGLLFIGLKLGGIIAWSWWWVLAPLWIPTALAVVLFVIALAAFARG